MAQHEKFYLKCKNIECDYREQTPRMIKDFIRYIDNYKCPKCSNGKNKTERPQAVQSGLRIS